MLPAGRRSGACAKRRRLIVRLPVSRRARRSRSSRRVSRERTQAHPSDDQDARGRACSLEPTRYETSIGSTSTSSRAERLPRSGVLLPDMCSATTSGLPEASAVGTDGIVLLGSPSPRPGDAVPDDGLSGSPSTTRSAATSSTRCMPRWWRGTRSCMRSPRVAAEILQLGDNIYSDVVGASDSSDT